ncbi:uncharacterized protein LOC122544064 isoform X3 [Chiloscyllium plagiosum]|uniref:uncharacterized protein LOC122544064 isoform X3 n=1 Tax=Chiloscyllium plagiosum TaxID=36176 RepID=UPI001CB826AA|nr:uncharacterized protein LOC122544064 isoform X3 [Chiloscyllium plagiosum]
MSHITNPRECINNQLKAATNAVKIPKCHPIVGSHLTAALWLSPWRCLDWSDVDVPINKSLSPSVEMLVMQVLLGVVQVLGGIVLAITVPYSPAVKIATPWWSGVMSIISGVVCIRCAGAPTEEFLIPWTLTCVLIGFSVWDLVVTIPVCVAYYKHHPRVRRYHHTH